MSTSNEFQEFVASVTASTFLEELGRRCFLPLEQLQDQIALSVAESGQTLRVLAGLEVAEGDRIIEIGAGLGLTSAYLATCGFDVTALEPGGIGFEANRTISRELATLLGANHQVLSIGAEDLDEHTHGRFALMYSNNVLEHVNDPREALSALTLVMSSNGLIVQSCPNYSIPYEPHFGLPLIPGRPRWTEKLLPESIRSSSVWRSLNFVRAKDIVETAKDLGLEVRFRPAALATSLERLGSEPEFRARHRALSVFATGLRRCGLLSLLRRLPPTWSTPMDFVLFVPGTDLVRVEKWLRRGQ